MGARVTLRDATETDLPAILAIYNNEVLTGVATFDLEPRTLEQQRSWLYEHGAPHCAIVAVDRAGEVVAYASLSRFRPRPAYRFTVEDTVYVRPDRQRQGIGRALLENLILRARQAGFHTMLGLVTADNVASIELHRACGFVETGRDRELGHKFGRWLDIITMQRFLDR